MGFLPSSHLTMKVGRGVPAEPINLFHPSPSPHPRRQSSAPEGRKVTAQGAALGLSPLRSIEA